MRRALLAVLVLCACGPQATEGEGLKFDFTIAAGIGDTTSGLQVSIVNRGMSLSCADVQNNCLVDQVGRDRFVQVRDKNGDTHLALTFPLALTAGNPSTQNVSVGGIQPGTDYAVVIEALSKDSPPKLAGSSCNYVKQISAGNNAQLIAATIVPPAMAVGCDPRVEK